MNNNKITAMDVYGYIKGLYGQLNNDEGILFGSPENPVGKIQVCWMADMAAIRNATGIGADLIVAHEALVYPYPVLNEGGSLDFMSWRTNYNRLRLLSAEKITVIRAHGTLDKFCIYDDFAGLLGLSNPVAMDGDWSIQAFDAHPVTYGEMIKQVKSATGLPYVRATNGDKNRIIKRVGLPWGGLGLSVNIGYQQRLVELGCDLFIAGEVDNYGLRFAADAGIDMIETGHEVSENPGLKHFSQTLGKAFPSVSVVFFENEPLWSVC